MKAVFLDASTFSSQADLPKPSTIDHYQVYDSTEPEQVIQRCLDADIIITNKVIIDRSIIEKLPKLKLIQLTATGMNNIDQAACEEHQVKLMNVAGYSIDSVPEHTFMLILSAMRACRHYHQAATEGAWQADGRFCLLDQPIYDLANKTIGIIGAGLIGRRVGQIAQAFGMQVLYAEHQNKPPRDDSYTEFDTVLATSDIISLHCPLTPKTQHLINKNTIAKMIKKPLLVNVARGSVVDSQSVVDALNNEQILGYASDVFESEPFDAQEPLLAIKNHPRVIFTPHNAWGSLSAQHKLWSILSQQVNDFIHQFNKSTR